jgi:hypothetical protein
MTTIPTAERVNTGPSVWIEIENLIDQHKPVNLGKVCEARTIMHPSIPMCDSRCSANLATLQGFPDWQSPDFIKQAGCIAIANDHNQYTR